MGDGQEKSLAQESSCSFTLIFYSSFASSFEIGCRIAQAILEPIYVGKDDLELRQG